MLPPGHIAAGYLTAEALLFIVKPDLSPIERQHILLWGAWWGFAPDLDTFLSFWRAKSFTFKPKKADEVNHRKFSSHAPVAWLAAGLLLFALAPSTYWKMVALLVWLGSWSHFFLDTVQYGIMWLWPWKKEIFAFRDKEYSLGINTQGFINYWWSFVKAYSRQISFYLEVLIIIIAIALFSTKY